MISVCIATYNGEKFVREQISSILSQLSKDDEVVVSDDGSSDRTVDLVMSINDPRIRIVKGPCRSSLIANFENALKLAKGDYIFLSDQDDIWMENKVEITLKYLATYDCIVSDAIVVDENKNILKPSFFIHNSTHSGRFYNLIVKNGYLGCCMAFRKQVLEKSLPFDKHIPMHDIWIGNVAAFKFKTRFISEKLIMYRRHSHNNSTAAQKSDYSIKQRIMFRINIIKPLVKLLISV